MNRQERRRAAREARKRGMSAGIAAAGEDLQTAFQTAVDHYRNEDLGAAETQLQRIDAAQPGIFEVCYLLGLIQYRLSQLDDAVATLQRATAIDRRNPEPYNVLGTALRALGRTEPAIAAYEKAIARNRRFTDAYYNLATLLRDEGRPAEALAPYRQAIELEPEFADAHYNLGLAFSDLGRYEEAVARYDKALSLAPGQPDVHIGLAKSMIMLHRYAEAESHCRSALALHPDSMEAHSNLARALQSQGQTDAAVEEMRRAIALAPDRADLHANLGNILQDQAKLDEAEAAYRQAVAIDPDFAEGHANLGLLLLLNRRYEEGWRAYDWRWRIAGRPSRPFSPPRWAGEPLAGKTILAWADEGAGDEILFASLLNEIIDAAGTCLVECDARLAPLFARSFPGAEVYPRQDPPAERLRAGDIDVQTPFSELPRWLRPDLANAPKPEKAYLIPEADLTEACRTRYRARGDGLIVGISWASGNLLRPERNAPLPLWEPILTQPGLHFVSLQYGDHAADMADVRDRLGTEIFVDPEVDQFASLEQFAAQVAAVDIVVSITNTSVHMAGALGKPVWTMLPFMPDWRYQQERPDTPWYPEMRLYRQRSARRWDDVIARVAADLDAYRTNDI